MREGEVPPEKPLSGIREAVGAGRYVFTVHAVRQAEERHITPADAESAILDDRTEVIEQYRDDPGGPSYLVLGWTHDGRPLHVHVSAPPLVFIITVYEPTEERWIDHRVSETRASVTENCAYCQGELVEKTVTYTTENDGRVIVVENVPALVCDQCGETLFRPEIVEKLQRIVWGETPQTREAKVPFYDFEQVA